MRDQKGDAKNRSCCGMAWYIESDMREPRLA